MKQRLILVFLFFTGFFLGYSQDIEFPDWGDFSEYEKNLTVYEKDSTAVAVVLKEVGYSSIYNGGNYEVLKKHYVRIKILKKEGFKKATVKIATSINVGVMDIEGRTTNIGEPNKTSFLNKEAIFRSKVPGSTNITSFTLPNIQVGSIIEYSYTKVFTSHRTFAGGWVFQSDIPKINSTYYAMIPAFWDYHIVKIGLLDTKPKKVEVIENCMKIQGAKAGCLFLFYSIDSIPAFVEENYISSKYNYLKQLSFELKKITNVVEEVTYMTKTWEEVERDFFTTYYIGRKYGKKRFISKRLPKEIEAIQDNLLKAKRVYEFIQKHYTWNRGLGLYYESDYKKAFKKGIGNMAEINMALINALLAVGLDANITLLSTRNNGFLTKLHPVISDFNYMVAQVRIDGKDYYLDAVDKKLTFGMLPFRCLNGNFRVFDKVKGGYWVEYEPSDKAITKVYAIANVLEDARIEMKTRLMHLGYAAYDKRVDIMKSTDDEYTNNFESDHPSLEIIDHKLQHIRNLEKPLIEEITIETETTLNNANTLYLNPFVLKEFEQNPFKLDQRLYPVDLGYKRLLQYNLTFLIPEGYQIKAVPKSRNIVLPNSGGTLVYLIKKMPNKITINFTFSLDKTIYYPCSYQALKGIVAQLIKAQDEMIVLTKI